MVEEKSACIDGHRKEALPTDHLKINKYYGHDDPCYRRVYPIIVEMASQAAEMVQRRLHRGYTVDLASEVCLFDVNK